MYRNFIKRLIDFTFSVDAVQILDTSIKEGILADAKIIEFLKKYLEKRGDFLYFCGSIFEKQVCNKFSAK